MLHTLAFLLCMTSNSFPVQPQQVPTYYIQTERPQLLLYYSPGCFYCHRILSYLQGIHKTVPLKTIDKDKKAKKELKKMGGKAQIPCLMINGQALYESEAIIQWLSQHQDLLDSVS